MATVNEAMMCPQIAKEAIDDYRRDPALIILIGHSVGGACVFSFAEMLQDEHIPVSLLVTTEPARISHDVPLNVERYINIYQVEQPVWGLQHGDRARLSRPRRNVRSRQAQRNLRT